MYLTYPERVERIIRSMQHPQTPRGEYQVLKKLLASTTCLELLKICRSTLLIYLHRTLYSFKTVFKANFLVLSLHIGNYFISCLVGNVTGIPWTVVDRVLQCGVSTVWCAIVFNQGSEIDQIDSCVVLSLCSLLIHHRFILTYMLKTFWCVVYETEHPLHIYVCFPNTGDFIDNKQMKMILNAVLINKASPCKICKVHLYSGTCMSLSSE